MFLLEWVIVFSFIFHLSEKSYTFISRFGFHSVAYEPANTPFTHIDGYLTYCGLTTNWGLDLNAVNSLVLAL